MNADFNGSASLESTTTTTKTTKTTTPLHDDDDKSNIKGQERVRETEGATVITPSSPPSNQSLHKDNENENEYERSVNQLNKQSVGLSPRGLLEGSNIEKSKAFKWRLKAGDCCLTAPAIITSIPATSTSAENLKNLTRNNKQQDCKVSSSTQHLQVKSSSNQLVNPVASSTSSSPALVKHSCSKCSIREQQPQQQQQQVSSCSSSLDDNFSSSNSSLFWKFLSNLPKSITQRSKSITSSTLTPEVAGYLASKQQQSRKKKEKSTTSASASKSEEGEQNLPLLLSCNNQSTTMIATSSKSSADQTVCTTSTKEMEEKSVRQKMLSSSITEAQEVSNQQEGSQAPRQLSQDGQRLIRIVAPQLSATPVDLTEVETSGDAQQQQLKRLVAHTKKNNDDDPAATKVARKSSQVKLSIATTCTTSRSSASSLSSCMLSDSTSTSEVRLKWGKKMDFLLSIIGFAVDLANIWRFPYLVYKNGGGVFLIPYLIMLIFGGIPLFFLELCLGQFVKKGPITVWNKICPSMKGVGYCSILISWYVSFYYNVLIAWSVYFIYRSLLSFGEKMPWEDCDNSWNSKGTCVSISQLKNLCSTRNESLEACRKDLFASVNVTSPASEFFVKELSQIDQSSGLDDMGYLRIELVLCTMIVYLLHYFSLFKGLETSGKVVWVTATAPYMILSILLVRGLFLPGASMGIEYYLSPKLEKLMDPQVWIDASTQVFYSIGVGFGVHLTYASFNSHNNNCYRDCLMTSAVNAATSVYSGLVVFVYLGYMAKNLGIEIDKVASEGYSLVFEVYPEALTTLPFARFWSILFFIMLLTLGIDSAMGGLEAVITGLEDEFKFAKRLSRGQLTGLVIISSFIPALISCTQGGAYTLFWFDIYSAGVSLLFSALFETIGVVYCYGLDKFIPNIESMLGKKPHIFYIMCWKYISPIFLGGVIFMSLYTVSVPTYRGYTFPLWSIILGWCLAFSSVSAIPIVAALHWYSKRGKTSATSERRKRDRSLAVGSTSSSSRKSPNHKSVLVSFSGKTPSGLTNTTTTALTTPH